MKILLVDKSFAVTDRSSYNVVGWESKMCTEFVDSSTAAELFALKRGVKKVWRVFNFCTILYRRELPVTCYIDNKPVVHQLESGVCKEEPRLQGVLNYIRQSLQ